MGVCGGLTGVQAGAIRHVPENISNPAQQIRHAIIPNVRVGVHGQMDAQAVATSLRRQAVTVSIHKVVRIPAIQQNVQAVVRMIPQDAPAVVTRRNHVPENISNQVEHRRRATIRNVRMAVTGPTGVRQGATKAADRAGAGRARHAHQANTGAMGGASLQARHADPLELVQLGMIRHRGAHRVNTNVTTFVRRSAHRATGIPIIKLAREAGATRVPTTQTQAQVQANAAAACIIVRPRARASPVAIRAIHPPKQTSKQTSKQANKQTNKQASRISKIVRRQELSARVMPIGVHQKKNVF